MNANNNMLNSVKAVLGKDAVVSCKRRKMSKKQSSRFRHMQKAAARYMKLLVAAHEATKNSTLKFG